MFLVPGGFHEADVRNDGVDDAVVCAAGCDCVVFVVFGTGKGLLWYGICARCKKQAPVVRDAFSGAPGVKTGYSGTGVIFGTGNPLLWYGADIRCAEQPSVVRDAFSKALGAQNSLLWYATRFQGPPGTQQPPTAASGAQKSGWQLPLRGLSTLGRGRGKGPPGISSALAGQRKWRKGPERTK